MYGTPLEIAVKNKNHVIVRELIEKGADVNARSNISTPLITAVNGGDHEMVKLLLESGARIDVKVGREETALSCACQPHVPVGILKLLLDTLNTKFDENCRPSLLKKPMQEALTDILVFYREAKQKVLCLLQAGAERKSSDFCNVISQGSYYIVEFMLTEAGYRCDNEVLAEALDHLTVTASTVRVIDLLLEQDDIDIEGTKRKRIEAHLFLEAPFNELAFYVSIGDLNQVRILLPTVDKVQINEALIVASELGRAEMISVLLAAGADINFICSNKMISRHKFTPLMLAAEKGYVGIVNMLLIHRADVNVTVNYNQTSALYLATEREHVEVVESLLGLEDIDINVRSYSKNITVNQLGLASKNQRIRNAYQIKNAKPSIDVIKEKISDQIRRFRKNAQSWLSIGDSKKADRIEAALNRAADNLDAQLSIEAFLTYKASGWESILDALSYNRIGFFGTTTSRTAFQEFVNDNQMKTQSIDTGRSKLFS